MSSSSTCVAPGGEWVPTHELARFLRQFNKLSLTLRSPGVSRIPCSAGEPGLRPRIGP